MLCCYYTPRKTKIAVTQRYTLNDCMGRAKDDAWCHTRKLGSLLGEAVDLTRRRSLASAALHRMWGIWTRNGITTEATCLRLNNVDVLLILLSNCGTWMPTDDQLHGIESFHRKQLRPVIDVRCPETISNASLDERCDSEPLRCRLLKAHWQLFGHILRRPDDIPANLAMAAYFENMSSPRWQGRRPTTLPSRLDSNLHPSQFELILRDTDDLEFLRAFAQDRRRWKTHITDLINALPHG